MGLDHETAPLSIREMVAVSEQELIVTLQNCSRHLEIDEVMILSTCNRTEVYGSRCSAKKLLSWFLRRCDAELVDLEKHLYVYEEGQAVQHLFGVASGIHSMVLGETQIFGQVKNAFRKAKEAGTLGGYLDRMAQRTFAVAKAVRTDTEIGAHAISLGAAALRIAERIYPNVSSQSILFVGAGEMIKLCLEHFRNRGFKGLYFTNRTLSSAQALANEVNGIAFDFDRLRDYLHKIDIVISCTSSPLPIIGKGAVENALRGRNHQPMLLIDLAVPRDVEAEAASLDDVFLFSIDDMNDIVRTNIRSRQQSIEGAEKIIVEGVRNFLSWIDSRSIAPTLNSFRQHGEKIAEAEIRLALDDLENRANPEEVVRRLGRSLMRKFLHTPSQVLGSESVPDRRILAQALSRLYSLPEDQ